MSPSIPSRLQSANLIPFVRQALGKLSLEIVDWQCQQLSAGGSRIAGGLGVYRVSGTARDNEGDSRWSLILKIVGGGTEAASNDPAVWNYWKREVLVNQSGLLNDLPGGLAAPRCYAVVEYPGDEFWMWMEDVREAVSDWSMAEHGLAARHLGEFNGAYLVGHPLPEATPWLTWGRAREWSELTAPMIEASHQQVETPLGRRYFPGDSFERTLKVWENHARLLEAFERLPVCFCHHDAFRRNLFLRQNEAGSHSTVAIDWAFVGFGRVGEEIGITTANNLIWMEVALDQAKALDEAVFAGYVEGLRDAGWKGDARLVRLGYLVNAVLVAGLAWPMIHLGLMQAPEWVDVTQKIIGHPIDEVFEAWSAAQFFLLDLADEAFKLADDLQ
jgi:hypothetical protein